MKAVGPDGPIFSLVGSVSRSKPGLNRDQKKGGVNGDLSKFRVAAQLGARARH